MKQNPKIFVFEKEVVTFNLRILWLWLSSSYSGRQFYISKFAQIMMVKQKLMTYKYCKSYIEFSLALSLILPLIPVHDLGHIIILKAKTFARFKLFWFDCLTVNYNLHSKQSIYWFCIIVNAFVPWIIGITQISHDVVGYQMY